jgi:hypothetical protein
MPCAPENDERDVGEVSLLGWLIMYSYCTILINSAITGHRPSGHGRNSMPVPCPSEVGRL